MKRIAQHALFWTFFVLWSSATFECPSTYWQVVAYTLVRLPVIMLATYILIYVILPQHLIHHKNYLKFAALFVLNFLIATLVDRDVCGSPMVDYILQAEDAEFYFFVGQPIFRNSFLLLSIMGIASLIKFFKLYIEKENRTHQLQQENLETRHAFLKAQVNPHFLFNALNNIYSMAVQKDQEDIASSLENLSGIMQYLTYDSSTDYVALKKEIELLQHYVQIQHMRLSETDDVMVSFNVKGDINGKSIAPVILLPLVENAFKHGIKMGEQCLISINLTLLDNQLELRIKNTLFEDRSNGIRAKGIGVNNVQKRLEFAYPGRYSFQTKKSASHFYSTLQIDLN